MGLARYALIGSAAAACAAGVLALTVTVFLPTVCQEGLSPDKCLVGSSADVAGTSASGDARSPIEVVTVDTRPVIEFQQTLVAAEEKLPVRSVRSIAIKSGGEGQEIVGSMMLPEVSSPVAADALEPPPATEMAEPVLPILPDEHDVAGEVIAVVETTPPQAENAPMEEPGQVVAMAVEASAAIAEPNLDEITINPDHRRIKQGVNVRSGPNKTDTVLFTLNTGKSVKVIGEDKGWLNVEDDSGRTGWLYKDFAE